jgi:hypothetical protein
MELLRQPLGAVQALEQAAAENLFHESRVEVGELQELSLLCKFAIGKGHASATGGGMPLSEKGSRESAPSPECLP